MTDWNPRYILLIFGLVFISFALVYTHIGKVWVGSRRRWVYQAKEPGCFWWEITVYWLCGFPFIGCFLYRLIRHYLLHH
jgi:hypothetical protein